MWTFKNVYLVCDIKPPIYFHQTPENFFEAPSRFRKGQLISIQKISRKQKINKYFVKRIPR